MNLSTLITIKVSGGHFMDWMDLDLPAPLETKEVNLYGAEYWNGKDDLTPYEITYAIDGFFGTASNKQFLHDVAARIAYSLNGTYSISKINTNSTYTLSRFLHLDRVPSFNTGIEENAFNGSRNEIFDALRYKAYRMHKTNTLNLEALTVYGNQISNGSEHVKYLAPNVFKWVETNYTGRQSTMSRSEAATNASKIKSNRVKSKIFDALKTPLFYNLDNISSLSRSLSVSRSSFNKYLSQFEQIKKASSLIQRVLTPYVRLVYTVIEEMQEEGKKAVLWLTKEDLVSLMVAAKSTAPPDIYCYSTKTAQKQNKQG